MAQTFKNVPNVEVYKLDGNLAIQKGEVGKRLLVLGTASKGPGMEPYRVRTAASVRGLFGTSGSLIRGYYQALASGYTNIWVMRIGAKGAIVEGIGGLNPYNVYTVAEDADVNDYTIYYMPQSGAGILKVWTGDPDASDTILVYDSENSIDLGYVTVSGAGVGGAQIGTESVPITITALYNDYIGAGAYGLSFVELGTDGVVTNPTKCQLYEYYYNAFELITGMRFERVVPMDIYADDWSIAFINPGDTVEGIEISALAEVLPTNLREDVLGWLNVYKDTYGVNQFTWAWDLAFDAAGGVGWSTAAERTKHTQDDDTTVNGPVGCPEANGGYHEVDFAYLLANFCYQQSTNDFETSGCIGVNPPASYSMRQIYQWVGILPVYDSTTTESDAPYRAITTEGTGLCGLPYTVGCLQASRNILARSTSTTTFYPGYYGTDTSYPDGGTLEDEGGHVIDIGKYIDIFATWPRYMTAWDRTQVGYSGSGAAWYGGFTLLRPSYQAATNKLVPTDVIYPYQASKTQLDNLVTARIVHLQRKDRGVVVCSACTAAMLNSDFVRQSGRDIVMDITTAIRNACDPFLGNGFGVREKSALDTVLSSTLESFKPNYITWFDFEVTPGAIRGTLGSLRIDLHLVVVNEIGKISIVVGMQRDVPTTA